MGRGHKPERCVGRASRAKLAPTAGMVVEKRQSLVVVAKVLGFSPPPKGLKPVSTTKTRFSKMFRNFPQDIH